MPKLTVMPWIVSLKENRKINNSKKILVNFKIQIIDQIKTRIKF